MRLKLILLSILSPLFLMLHFSPAGAVDLFGGACTGSAANSPTCQQASKQGGNNNPVTGSKSIINSAVNIIAVVTGLAAVIMIIISGFKFVTAGNSNSDAAKSARATLTAAIIGLIIVALAWPITRFIVDRVVQ